MKDHNPDTINKLIGAKVISYRDLKPKMENKTSHENQVEKDLELKKDKHLNEPVMEENQSYYASLKPMQEVKTEKECEETCEEKCEDEAKKGEVKYGNKRMEDAYSYLTLDSEDDNFAEQEKNAGSTSDLGEKNVAKVVQGAAGLLNAPKKKWYKPGIIHKYQAKKHYKKVGSNLASGVAGAIAKKHGASETEQEIARQVGSKVGGSGAKSLAKRFLRSKKK